MRSAGGLDVRVVVVGDVMTDVVARVREPLRSATDTPGEITLAGGGAGANTAMWLAESGIATAFVGRLGADERGRLAIGRLRHPHLALHVTNDSVNPTGTVVVIVDPTGERTMVPDRGANAHLSTRDLPDSVFVRGRHLHLSGYTLLDSGSRLAGLQALDLARLRGMTTSVDPASVGPILDVGVDEVLGWLRGVDVVLANDAEAQALTGLPDPVAAGAALARIFPTAVVKTGAAGALAWRDGRGPVWSPAVPVVVLDTTGAGDAFAAGFLPRWLDGDDLPVCLAEANRTAARCVSVVGARP